ncbi:MAG: efflux RND transporter permease subunit [Alphaproteobacteria bacterium]|nr:efflux RND transporter permease subunit [Alphaproteobacteria bacterium]
MQWLAEISVRRPVFAWVMILSVVVLGLAGWLQLGVDRFPKVDVPMVVVVTALPGAAPQEIESEVTDPIEAAVNTLSGIDELRSTSSEGVSQVMVSFALDKDIDVAVQEVRDALARVTSDLPDGTRDPVVSKFDPDALPILVFAVDGPASARDVTELADKKLRPALESTSGVGQVTLLGGRPRQINVWLEPDRLAAFGLVAQDVRMALARENLSAPGGALESGSTRMAVRLEGRVEDVEQLARIVVRQVDGHPVRLEDVARVEDGAAEASTVAEKDGNPALLLSVRKQSGTNTVEVVDAVRARADRLAGELPEGWHLTVVKDNSEVTRTSLDAINEHLLVGGFFAAVIVLLFLGDWRSTVISALAILTSVVGAFAMLWAWGLTLNSISMLALALSVGIVIDDAIVVLENIHRYVHEEKVKPYPAAILGTREIGLAVLATTLSLIAVFLPVAFLGGVPGRFLRSFGLTMVFAILVSLFVSFTLTPMLSARMLRSFGDGHDKPWLERVADRVMAPLDRAYHAVLEVFVRYRIISVALGVLTFVSIFPLARLTPKGFLPKSDEAQLQVDIRAPEGTSLARTQLYADRVIEQIRAVTPELEQSLLTIGDSNAAKPNEASVTVRLVPPGERAASQEAIVDRIRDAIGPRVPPELVVKVGPVPIFGSSSNSSELQYLITGPDLDTLAALSQDLKTTLKGIPGAVDVDTNLILGRPELQVRVDRERASDLGVSVADIGSTLQMAFGGVEVGTYAEGGEQYAVYLRADADARERADQLAAWTLPSSSLGRVPLTDVVTLVPAEGPSSIERYNRQRYVLLSANLASGYALSQVMEALEAAIAQKGLPPGYSARPFGRSRELGKMLRSFMIAFGLSIVFMYLVLAAQFESWMHPITILISLPLTVPFALFSALVMGFQLDLYTMLGILVLFGVVKKNSILQVDRIIQLREQGMSRTDAVMRGARDRLRPILMTTIAFVAGMLPLLVAHGVGAGLSQAIAGVVIGGQSLSLVLTLLITPVAYTVIDDLASLPGRIWRSRATPASTGSDQLDPSVLDAIAAEVSARHAAGSHP